MIIGIKLCQSHRFIDNFKIRLDKIPCEKRLKHKFTGLTPSHTSTLPIRPPFDFMPNQVLNPMHPIHQL